MKKRLSNIYVFIISRLNEDIEHFNVQFADIFMKLQEGVITGA